MSPTPKPEREAPNPWPKDWDTNLETRWSAYQRKAYALGRWTPEEEHKEKKEGGEKGNDRGLVVVAEVLRLRGSAAEGSLAVLRHVEEEAARRGITGQIPWDLLLKRSDGDRRSGGALNSETSGGLAEGASSSSPSSWAGVLSPWGRRGRN